eukprot:3511537-Lingulodinium_polyedra.AAC.1
MRQGRPVPGFHADVVGGFGALYEFDPADPEQEEKELVDDETYEPTGAMRLRLAQEASRPRLQRGKVGPV